LRNYDRLRRDVQGLGNKKPSGNGITEKAGLQKRRICTANEAIEVLSGDRFDLIL
jgi:hypothetical protein